MRARRPTGVAMVGVVTEPSESGAASVGLIDRLRAYAPSTAREMDDTARTLAMSERDDARPWDRTEPLHITASALVVHPPTRRVLLRWHERQQGWLQIGGHGDPGEDDPLLVALREGAEETGLVDLRPWPSDELRHVVVVPVAGNAREPAHEHADVRFVLSTDDPDSVQPENPAAELRWLTVDEALTLVGEDNVGELIRRAATLFD